MIYQGSARHPVRTLIIHCTATPSNWRPKDTPAQRVQAIRRIHMVDRGWRDIGYHRLIDRDGTALQGRPDDQIGSHVAGHNSGTIGISLFGGITSKAGDPFLKNYTPAQEATLIREISRYSGLTTIIAIRGHNEYDNGKACPGFNVPAWLKQHGILN